MVFQGFPLKTPRKWRVEDFHEGLTARNGHRNLIRCASFSGCCRYVCTGAFDGVAKIWSVLKGDCLQTLSGAEGSRGAWKSGYLSRHDDMIMINHIVTVVIIVIEIYIYSNSP